MKTKTLLLAFVLFACVFSANSTELLVSEDFASDAWQAEFAIQNPGDPNAVPPKAAYALPTTTGANYGLNSVPLYFEKYFLNGAILIDGVTTIRTCADSIAHPEIGTEHKESTTGVAVGFRFRSGNALTNTGTYMEFPELPTAGLMTLHVRDANSTATTTLQLQQFDYGTSAWTTIHTFDLRPYNEFWLTSLDEIVTWDISSTSPIKLRIIGGAKFAYLYRVDIAAYAPNALETVKAPVFKLVGRKLIASELTNISLYNLVGAKVFEKSAQSEVELPASLGKGIFFVKSNLGSQKIILN